MVFKRLLLLELLFFLSLNNFLYAQNEGFFIDNSGDEPRFFQRLAWSADEYVLYFEVLIQRQEFFEYRDYYNISTEENFLTVSLPPGTYRYSVTPRNLLGQKGEMSEWRPFEVLPAYKPSIENFFPLAFFMDKRAERVLEITGNNLLEESDFFLSGVDNSLFPIDKEILDTNTARLYFDDFTLIPGDYDIYVKNPGGLETIVEGFKVAYSKPVDFFLKLSWMPIIPIYGEMYDIFGSKLYAAGMALNFEAVSTRRGSFNGGLEVSISGNFINPVFSANSGMENITDGFLNSFYGMSWIETNINMLMRKQFLQRLMAFTFRFGIGLTSITRYSGYDSSYTENEFLIQWNLGFSYMLLLFDIFCIETGIDYSHYNASELSGAVKPRLSIGWQF